MKSYIFPVVIEPDGDRWHAFIPELEARGGATWGYTRDEAAKNIQEVGQMVIESMLEDGEVLPANITISDQQVMAVSV
jgi:predicted RNase H-like HicB family nuclease